MCSAVEKVNSFRFFVGAPGDGLRRFAGTFADGPLLGRPDHADPRPGGGDRGPNRARGHSDGADRHGGGRHGGSRHGDRPTQPCRGRLQRH